MKLFIPLLIYLISITSAEVLVNLAQLKEESLEFDESNLGGSATHHLSQISYEDLVKQKFLLDVLQHVNEPIVNKDFLQILSSQYEQFIDDENLYNGGIDYVMAEVIEMSRNKQLLGKQQIFTIAKDEHMRQMVGLYLLLVHSRDWATLQQNILHARIHVNGVLLVNSLLLAIRDRDDTQNLVVPGIHEILPKLYIDEDVISRAQGIDLSQLATSHELATGIRRPRILDMIRFNKLLHSTASRVSSLDRRELWMPWLEMRLEIQARKTGGINRPTHVSVRDDDRIVLPVTQPTNLAGDQGEARILTADAGFQSFMHNFMNDLCIFEYEQNMRWSATGSNKADLTRVGLKINKGAPLERDIRLKDVHIVGEDTRDVHAENIDKDSFIHVDRGRGLPDRFVGAELLTATGDERLLYASRNRQHADADSKMYSRDEENNIDLDTNTDWDDNRGWSRVQSDNNQVNVRSRFLDTTKRKSISVHNEFKNYNPNNVNEDSLNMDINMGMPIDLKKLPVVDINNERLLKVGRRRMNQLNWSMKQSGQRWRSEAEKRHSPEVNTHMRTSQPKLNLIHQKDIHNVIGNGRLAENPRIWTTVARGMGNIGIHVGPQFERQNGTKSGEKHHGMINNIRRPYIYWGNDDYIGIQDTGSDIGSDTWHQRSPRSLTDGSVLNHRRRWERTRGGELILHNFQQLVARITLERTSLGLRDYLQLQENTDSSRFNTRRNQVLLEKVNEVEKRLQEKIEQELLRTIGTEKMQNVLDKGSIDHVIADVLMGKEGVDQDVNILNILRGIILQTEDANGGVQKLAHLTINAGDPYVLHFLRRIVHIAETQRQQQLGGYRKEEIKMNGITINEVKVDKLRTYIGTSDTDLINALNDLRSVEASQKMVVARQQRLNHKTFTVKIDVTSDRNQRVVVRTLLGPKIDAAGRGMSLNDQRQNFILLDAYIANLHTGRNQIKRKSHDISWTSRDTTPFSEIYKRVMQALNGQVDATLDRIQGQNCRFPHRLLLPRGRIEGLPMQMLVVITQGEDVVHTMQGLGLVNRVCTIGMGTENLDRLPFGFPLDRPLVNEDQIISLPNVHLADVQIYHDNQLKVYDWINNLHS
ncbi:fat-body protein 1-like [Rhagoletis pomonella]|uniref:fat-body protein 1-like n=1 Tax=Rhagoletis pomonella TaxID=28610 RepID=UPI00177B84DB|nr:fat-body protein 1-like [Rhagoletis pomonella]